MVWQFGANGCDVVVQYNRDEPAARFTAESAQRQFGVKTWLVQQDFAQPGSGKNFWLNVKAIVGQTPDILVINAGFLGIGSNGLSLTEEELYDSIQVNAVQPFFLMQAMMNDPDTPSDSQILVHLSKGWDKWLPGYAGLGMAKALLMRMVIELAQVGAPRRICVNAITSDLVAQTDVMNWFPPHEVALHLDRMPFGRLIYPEDVAIFFCHTACNLGVTGQNLVFDGGVGNVA